ncbi:hypothetical protein JYQ62_08350 [Nostoc sp. UHCC 0702]|nr:hypothetical protein JYQ62_08350 [Nostoc sp. UHCC 0702]
MGGIGSRGAGEQGRGGEGDKSSKSLDFVQNHPPPQLLAHVKLAIGHWEQGSRGESSVSPRGFA